jgi:hypothetical protein
MTGSACSRCQDLLFRGCAALIDQGLLLLQDGNRQLCVALPFCWQMCVQLYLA